VSIESILIEATTTSEAERVSRYEDADHFAEAIPATDEDIEAWWGDVFSGGNW
jgi:hypothetical protein